jgi:hypothetical protein
LSEYLKLARHLEEVLSSEVQKEGKSRPAAKVDFINGCKLSLSDTIKHVTARDVVVMVKGKDQAPNDKVEFACKKAPRGMLLLVKSVKCGLEHFEEDDADFHVEAVYVKKAAPEIDGGFKRSFLCLCTGWVSPSCSRTKRFPHFTN